jgi:hypothetical protein
MKWYAFPLSLALMAGGCINQAPSEKPKAENYTNDVTDVPLRSVGNRALVTKYNGKIACIRPIEGAEYGNCFYAPGFESDCHNRSRYIYPLNENATIRAGQLMEVCGIRLISTWQR